MKDVPVKKLHDLQQALHLVHCLRYLIFYKLADYIIDMGPEGGRNGGRVLVTGTPEQVADCKLGYTSKYLKLALAK